MATYGVGPNPMSLMPNVVNGNGLMPISNGQQTNQPPFNPMQLPTTGQVLPSVPLTLV